MKLEEIGFYTLSNERADRVARNRINTPLQRCELLLTDRCNFRCPYCRKVKRYYRGDININYAKMLIAAWVERHLFAIRFSGGEPTLYDGLLELVDEAKRMNIKRIAISTNGSADYDYYIKLIGAGVNDFSVSLDACCSADGQMMTGIQCDWNKILNNIKKLSQQIYVSVGIVLTDLNYEKALSIITMAHDLGVADIRIIPAAQNGQYFKNLSNKSLPVWIDEYPILKYRLNRALRGEKIRGLSKKDCHKCYLVLDDMAVMRDYHFPCIIYLREGGNPIGKISPNIYQERLGWYQLHDTHKDIICQKNCLDVCVQYNNTVNLFKEER
jgi:molybdenum cofactor biosynthesis enzyme MoaA